MNSETIKENSIRNHFIILGSDDNIFGSEYTPHRVGLFGICICLSGSAEITVGLKKYKITEDDLCTIYPDDILHIRKKSSDFKGYVISLIPEFVYSINTISDTPIYLYIKDNRCISVSKPEQEDIIRRYEDVKTHETKLHNPCRKEILHHLTITLIYEIIGLYKKGETITPLPYSRKDQLYFDFIELINNYCKQERGIEFYANKLCVSSRYLSVVCKEIAGQTAKRCIDELVIIGIQTTLVSTILSIAEISDSFNFPNASFFTKYYKEHTGITPKQYRQIEKV